MHRILWHLESVSRQGLILRTFAETVFRNRNGLREECAAARSDQSRSCLFLEHTALATDENMRFIQGTELLEPMLMALTPRFPYILFAHFANTGGVTRGYPWKDMSVLPSDFKVTNYSFFYIADPRHNPDRTTKWTEPYLCPLVQRWMVTCSNPVYVGTHFVGVIGLDINLQHIFGPLDRLLRTVPQGYAFLVSSKGNLMISSDEGMERLREDDVLVGKGWTRKSGAGGRPAGDVKVEEVVLSSGKAYLLHTTMEQNGWSLISVLPKGRKSSPRKAEVPIRGSGRLSSEGTESDKTYLPMMSFISSFSESLKRMEGLIEGTKIIGSGGLGHRITVDGKDEIGLLAVSINKMAAELEKRREELASLHRKISQMDRLSALGQLTAGIAHEINNPLSIISNYIQILARNPNLHPDVLSDIQVVEEEIHRASDIIRKLLSFSGQSESRKGVFQVNEVLDNTLRLLRFQSRSQGIELVEHYDETLPLTAGSPTELQQAFLNILLNAIQAMAHGGRLEVSTGHKPKRGGRAKKLIDVTVADTGPGIEREFLDKVFDPFFSLKSLGEGTGLGLSISYGIVKEHGGSIEVKSMPGRGTRVTISLPVIGTPPEGSHDEGTARR